MSDSLRIALLLDPLSVYLEDPLNLRFKWGNHAPQLAQELLSRGHSVRGFGAPPGFIPRSGDATPDAGDLQKSWSRLLNFRPDVIVAYDALSAAAFRGARIARKLQATLVLVESGLRAGGRWHERTLWRVGQSLWGPYLRRSAHALVALDPVARAQALKAGFAKELIRVLPYGVDVARFRPGLTSTLVARHRIRGRILLYVGRLLPNRGLELFVSAFARTVGQRSDWNLVLAGEGSSKGELRAMVDRLGIADRTHFLARPRREELPGLLGASTLLAIPSLDGDVVGWQIGRALACGLPVLASDLPRLRTHLAHEETGLLVRPGDADAWAEAIQRAAGSPAARARWARQGRGVAERELSWSAVGAGFESVILAAREAVRADAPSADAVARVEGETS